MNDFHDDDDGDIVMDLPNDRFYPSEEITNRRVSIDMATSMATQEQFRRLSELQITLKQERKDRSDSYNRAVAAAESERNSRVLNILQLQNECREDERKHQKNSIEFAVREAETERKRRLQSNYPSDSIRALNNVLSNSITTQPFKKMKQATNSRTYTQTVREPYTNNNNNNNTNKRPDRNEAERGRREVLNNLFETLREILQLEDGNRSKPRKLAVLNHSISCITNLRAENTELKLTIQALNREILHLRSQINTYQVSSQINTYQVNTYQDSDSNPFHPRPSATNTNDLQISENLFGISTDNLTPRSQPSSLNHLISDNYLKFSPAQQLKLNETNDLLSVLKQ